MVEMRLGVDEKITVPLVMDQRQGFRFVKGRVADLVFVDAKILMQENAYFARLSGDLSRARGAGNFSWLATVSLELISKPEVFVGEFYIGDQASPASNAARGAIRRRRSTENSPSSTRRSEREAFGMVFLTDVRKINVADPVFLVKCDEQRTVSDRNVTHALNLET